MRGFSKAIIAGNLTRDPELRTTTGGRNVCSFTVAVNRTYRDASGGQREEVAYIDCNAWAALGETINKYARKGSGVLVSGRLRQDTWEDKATGAKRSRLEIVVEDFNFVGNSADREGGNLPADSTSQGSKPAAKPAAAGANKAVEADFVPEDIPEGEVTIDEVPF